MKPCWETTYLGLQPFLMFICSITKNRFPLQDLHTIPNEIWYCHQNFNKHQGINLKILSSKSSPSYLCFFPLARWFSKCRPRTGNIIIREGGNAKIWRLWPQAHSVRNSGVGRALQVILGCMLKLENHCQHAINTWAGPLLQTALFLKLSGIFLSLRNLL